MSVPTNFREFVSTNFKSQIPFSLFLISQSRFICLFVFKGNFFKFLEVISQENDECIPYFYLLENWKAIDDPHLRKITFYKYAA